MEVILTSGYAFLFFYIIRKNNFFRADFTFPWFPGLIFLLKCCAGILLGLLYTNYYTNHNDADTFKFFTDSKIMFDSLLTHPYDFFRMFTGIDSKAPELKSYYLQMDSWLNTNTIFNDNKTIIRLNCLFRFLSLGYYRVHVVLLNFISFTGIFCLFKTFSFYLPDKKKELFFLTFLMPSLVFWGSGLLKDGLLIAGFGFLIYSYTLLLNKGYSIKRLVFFLLGLTILMFTKIYVIVIILPGLLAWWLTHNSSKWRIRFPFLLIYGMYLIVAFNLYRIDPDHNVAAEIYYKQKNFIEIAGYHSATTIPYPHYECSGTSILKNAPFAFSNTMFRPFLTDVKGNPMILLSALENILIIFLILICLASFSSKGKRTDGFLWFCVAFVILLFILIGLITPVLGAIVRYKIVALPCLVFILTYFYDPGKLLKRFPLLKRFIKKSA